MANGGLKKQIKKMKRPFDCISMLYHGERNWGDVKSGITVRYREMGLLKCVLKGTQFAIYAEIGIVVYFIYRFILALKRHKWFVFVLVILAVWLALPALVDYHFKYFVRIYIKLFNENPTFDKETWFTVICTYFASLPGAMCGALAIIQTKRNHELEDRLRRPALRMESSSMEIKWFKKNADMLRSKDPYYSSYSLVAKGHEGRITWKICISCRDNKKREVSKLNRLFSKLTTESFSFASMIKN